MFQNRPPGFPESKIIIGVPEFSTPGFEVAPGAAPLVRQPPPELKEWKDYQLEQAKLSPKQYLITNLLLKGLSSKEVANTTGNTEKTIKHHIAAIFCKFGVSSRAELFSEIFPT